ncbi:sigma 54 modulation / S30EA ribosomal family protein [Chlamydia psittaci 02DC24]|uniref:HPF/RaiA family ribosome-associated protein n=1 Tax=Chlamydia psittaci TaxID=83554 RepID=UPI0003529DED|nr:sigma 54 modulation/S30EA ribosomal C-terminal domain-containing protein [Chlamydia psittaci]EPJ17227.1 sigma 54 modulation / S30EA ribosomal family protein [Chlamydia psittaci 02DC22]EPJ98531.1 sigma 54 modulation / S30EA ribosomal family protein [Chlamydia psittaci 02DC24]
MHTPQRRATKQKKAPKHEVANLEITGKSCHVSQPLRQLIMEKSNQLPPLDAIHIVLTSHKEKQGTEVHLTAMRGKETFQVKTQHTNPYSAVIAAFKKIRTLANKHQKIRQNKKKHDIGLSKKEEQILELEEDIHLYDDILPLETMDAWDSLKYYGYIPGSAKKVLSRKKINLPVLSEDEAIKKFESSQNKVLVFLNEKEHKIQLIHKQNDDNYVLIEPIIAPGFHIF